ncbi:MAG: glucose-1-phosphate cytidylyltransferase, partial [Proteobacteria bacterium]|nr:glucose-1-phosphate cytidylyltransferase [Pseudomonadota bacterium]
RGSRIAEETDVRPKPMVAIGGRPILWHILKIYGHYGLTDFTICLGYKGYVIKEYFANYVLHGSDVTIDLAANRIDFHDNAAEPWRVTLVDTGEATMTGGRLKRVAGQSGDVELFCMTYGDGLADVDIAALLDFHRGHGLLATMTVVQPPGRFGAAVLDGDRVTAFTEKPRGDGGTINGGFFVLEPEVADYIKGDEKFESGPLQRLAEDGQLAAYFHDGFWQPMDTLRDVRSLNGLWESSKAPWKIWK